jgi:endoglucanase
MFRHFISVFSLAGLLMAIPLFALSAEIVLISPLTDRIILVHVNEGHVIYPDNLVVTRLDVAMAGSSGSYTVTSPDDPTYSEVRVPVNAGRKSKGMAFVSNSGVPWGGSSFDPRSRPWVSQHWIYLELPEPMKSGHTYRVNTGDLATNGPDWEIIFAEHVHRSEAVHVNTLGYAPDSPKYAYVYHWMGDQGGLDLTSYNGSKFWVYKEGEEEVVFEGDLKKRTSATHPETGQAHDTPNRNFLGAEVYDCDFSALALPGEYYVAVEGIGRSYPFRIGPDPVIEAYYHGTRSLYHQRSGIRLAPPYTAEGYIRPVTQNTFVTSDDGTDFTGQLLYCPLPYVEWAQGEGGGASQAAIRDASIGNPLDVAGWYHDAGDWDGYASHQRIPKLLMLTWEAVPERFADGDLNIPESGNGIPDILDEASWLIKFNYRLRKELMDKGYSDGGVGGARVAPDFFSSVDGNAQSDKPSWKDHRRYVVSSADAYMTYMYAGQAAHFALILKRLGKDPESFPVEMLDHVDFDGMSHDTVNWIEEAKAAYDWASHADNQPSRHAHYGSELWAYRMYAAASLYRITGEDTYHEVAQQELERVRQKTNLAEDERYGVYAYILADNVMIDKAMQKDLMKTALGTANFRGMDAASIRGLRWGGIYDMPMLVGQGTTPWMFETIMAYAITGDKEYADVVHTTADYFLGSNPLHTTWMTGVGPRPALGGFHLDSRYMPGVDNWMVYPGFVPYGPWSMNYDYNPFTWVIDGVEMDGGAGPWNKDWANFSMYPPMAGWPGHERYNNNIHAPMSTENTVHQQSVYLAIAYGFVNSRINTNTGSAIPVGSIQLDQTALVLHEMGEQALLHASLDVGNGSFPVLRWTSSEPRIAHVDAFGRVTGVTGGTAVISCMTLDGSVVATCEVLCDWEDTEVNGISISPASVKLMKGQSQELTVLFDPADASNQFVDWTYSIPDVVMVDETNMLKALAAGTVLVSATSMQGGKTATVEVEVEERTDYVIADFDTVIPVTTSPQPDIAQVYTPGGTNDIAAANPLKGNSNMSERVVQWNRPAGDWKLIGMVLPTDHAQDLSKFSQFQFTYYGKAIRDIYVQIQTVEDTQIEIRNTTIKGEDCWQLFAADLDSELTMKQFNVFVNPTGNQAEASFFFDDFLLAGDAAMWYDGMTISESRLELEPGQVVSLFAVNEGNPFTWISSDPDVVLVDQEGMVTAIGDGIAEIKAVPLYGAAAVCEVNVRPSDVSTPSMPAFAAWEIRIYPNPNLGQFTVESPHPIKMLKVVDMMGRLVLTEQGSDQKRQLLVVPDGLAGVFVVRAYLQEHDGLVMQRIIIQ